MPGFIGLLDTPDELNKTAPDAEAGRQPCRRPGWLLIPCINSRGPPQFYPRSTPPVALLTAATILAATASISASVSVRSTGCRVTASAIDLRPSPSAAPSN